LYFDFRPAATGKDLEVRIQIQPIPSFLNRQLLDQPSRVAVLTQINLEDLVSSFALESMRLPAAILSRLFGGPARKFATQIVEYDDLIGQVGLEEASCQTLQKRFINDLRVQGQEHIPASGPVLFLSNHPGLADTISLFAAIPRQNLHTIALHRPFLASLPNTTRHLFYISDDPGERMRAVRQVSAHLRAGGAVLTFPAGKIEPDPDVHTGALDSLRDWTDSSGIFMRFAPALQIVPVLVSGVIWEHTAHHWLTRLKRTREQQEKLAAALQLLAMVARNARPTTVHVQFAKPITREEVGSMDPASIHEKLLERMHSLIGSRNNEDGGSIL
jgi:1-acyl-sn-glycerol-3-phosphate acyltransferase